MPLQSSNGCNPTVLAVLNHLSLKEMFRAQTQDWIKYAQSLTIKHMKGVLTGPVTIINWSFFSKDQPRAETCSQFALARSDEV